MASAVRDERPLVSINDAAKAAGRSYYEIYNLVSSGRLSRIKRGSRVYVPAAELRGFMDDPLHFSARRSAVVSPIFWRAIDAIPDDRRDGRDVLLWVADHSTVCSWDEGWRDPVGRLVRGVTHYADVEGPGV